MDSSFNKSNRKDLVNNFCDNCGEQILPGSSVCSKCGKRFFEEKNDNIVNTAEYKKRERRYIIIIVSLFLVYFSCSFLSISMPLGINNICPLFLVAAFIVNVVAKMVMPESKKIETLFCIFICFILVLHLLSILLMIACFDAIRSFPD